MLFQLSILAALVAPFASALTVSQPTQAVTSGGSMTINWTVENGDPGSFSIFLQNPTFNNVYAVANNVDASLGTLTISIPLVPENEQYTVQIVPIDNVNNVLAESPGFTIGASTTSVTSTTSASAISRSTTSVSTASSATVSTRSTSSFGVTVTSPLPSSTRTSTSTTATGAAASTSTNATFNNAATALHFNMNMGVVTSVVLSAVAGAAMFAF